MNQSTAAEWFNDDELDELTEKMMQDAAAKENQKLLPERETSGSLDQEEEEDNPEIPSQETREQQTAKEVQRLVSQI